MILVTGATGLLGSRLLFDLASSGLRVRALKRSSSRMNCVDHYFKQNQALLASIEWVDADLNDLPMLEQALEGVTDIFHCAGKVSFQPRDQHKVHQINTDGTANLINLALEKGIRKFCHVSSIAAIGKNDDTPIHSEDTPWSTMTFSTQYALSKYGAEREVWRGIAEGLNAVIVNPGLIIGPGNWKTDSSMLFRQVWKGLRFYTDGVNGMVDVRDVSSVMIRLMESDIHSERYIVVAENVPLRELMDRIADCFGKKRPDIHAGPILTQMAWRMEYLKSKITGSTPVITNETARTAQSRSYYSNDKIIKALHHEFIPIATAIKQTADVFKQQPIP